MRGGTGYQITKIFNDSGILNIGKSKHEAKALAREAGAKTWSDLGKTLNIYSYNTAEGYKDVWHLFAKFIKAEFKVKDVEKITPEHVQAFLESRISSGIARATLQKEAAALAKFENALNLYSSKFSTGNHYDFRKTIRATVKEALRDMPKADPHRAYVMPDRMIKAIADEKHRIAAQSQYIGGARIHEISLIKPEQLMGIIYDDLAGEKYGKIKIRGKGGKIRELILRAATYSKIEAIIQAEGEFSIDKNQYRADLRQACHECGIKYNASHGLRWNFAQDRMEHLQSRQAKSYEESLRIVSKDLGHQRADITEHYLR